MASARCAKPSEPLAKLQVSDREWLATLNETASRLEEAYALIEEGRGEEVGLKSAGVAPPCLLCCGGLNQAA